MIVEETISDKDLIEIIWPTLSPLRNPFDGFFGVSWSTAMEVLKNSIENIDEVFIEDLSRTTFDSYEDYETVEFYNTIFPTIKDDFIRSLEYFEKQNILIWLRNMILENWSGGKSPNDYRVDALKKNSIHLIFSCPVIKIQ